MYTNFNIYVKGLFTRHYKNGLNALLWCCFIHDIEIRKKNKGTADKKGNINDRGGQGLRYTLREHF